MRRAGSSCLLRPKSTDGVQSSQSALVPETQVPELAVTLLSHEVLPSYSSERFYLLSELEIHAHSSLYLCDYPRQRAARNNSDHEFPSYMILYLFWPPEASRSGKTFAETTILSSINHLESLVEFANAFEQDEATTDKTTSITVQTGNVKVATSATNLSTSRPLTTASSFESLDSSVMSYATDDEAELTVPNQSINGKKGMVDGETLDGKERVHVYVIVDRVHHTSDSTPRAEDDAARISRHVVEEDAAKNLAKAVSNHPKLRKYVDGITVGVSSHERAAPGLEACVKAVTYGASTRRRHGKSMQGHQSDESRTKSPIGVVSEHPDHFLGSQSQTVTDAVQGVLQTRVCAEWNGRGDLESFLRRADSCWRKKHGLPQPQEPIQRRKIPRRIRRQPSTRMVHRPPMKPILIWQRLFQQKMAPFFVYDVMVLLLIFSFIVFHFRDELMSLRWLIQPPMLEDLVQYLREL